MPEQYPTLSKAPITEALIDIRCKLPKGFDLDQFKTIGANKLIDYPVEKLMRVQEAEIKFENEVQKVTTQNTINGYRYESADKTKIVQLGLEGFTFNRLKPYIDWLETKDEALRLWKLYKEVAKPELVFRVALRYINNLNIPMPITDFRDYLTCPPEIPAGLPQGLASFFYKVVIPADSSGTTAIITQALEEKADVKDKLPVILDIDVFKRTLNSFSEEEIVAILEKLRELKNRIFFNSVTPKLLEIYK